MTKNKTFKLSFLALATTVLLTVSGCTLNISNQYGQPDSHDSHMMDSSQGDSPYSANDVMFAQMMIPHHEQAIEMSELAPGRATNQLVLDLALDISQEQDPEIATMRSWLKASGAGEVMDHDMPMSGMLTAEDIQRLNQASGTEFEELFLKGMIAHHEGALQMVTMVANSENQDVRALAEAITKSQTQQIELMRELLSDY